MQKGRVKLGDGCHLSWRLEGPVGAPVLVMSHSLGADMDMWALQVRALSQAFQVLRYDTRGHGSSDAPAGAYSLDRLGRDVVELLAALQIERAHFCGLSLGGMVGQWLGWRAPEKLDRLILANTAAYMGPPSVWDERIHAVRIGGVAAVADAVLSRWLTPTFAASHKDDVAVLRAMFLKTQPQGYAGACAAIRDMDLRRVNELIAAPSLVIAGGDDPATPPSEAQAIAAAVRDAILKELSAAHLSNVERPDDFTQAVMDFLDEGSKS